MLKKQALLYSYRDDSNVPSFDDSHPIIIFDGACVLCTGWVAFILRHDKHKKYKFLSAQSALGYALYQHYGLDPLEFETNVLLDKGNAWFKSEASIRMAIGLGFPWSMVRIARIFPLPVLDRLYQWVAKNRYRWFGKHQACYLPPAPISDRFLG